MRLARHTVRQALGLALAATLLGLGACSGGDEGGSKSEAKSESDPQGGEQPKGEESGSDEPAWVNAMHLTCAWESAASKSDAGVSCDVAGLPAGVTVEAWKVLNGDQTYSKGKQKAAASAGSTVFVLPAKDIEGLSPVVTLSDGKKQKDVVGKFKDLLEGMAGISKLVACFNADQAVGDCLAAAGIKVPGGDVWSYSSMKKDENACAHKDSLPAGVLCELATDAMVGDYDQGRTWFQNQNGLLGDDGTVKASDFCDANGIKEKWLDKATISRKARYFPNWLPNDKRSACFEGALPDKLDRKVMYDASAGVGGEPYCFFILLEEPTLFGTFTRMHILKNPKIFKDAANGAELSASSLEATATYFDCGK